jgi:ATP synthase protein I
MANWSRLQRNPGRALSLQWLLWQIAVVATLVVIYCLLAGIHEGYSAFLGGFISVLASGYFAWKAFSHSGARQAVRIVLNLYAGEALKLIIAALGLAVAFKWGGVQPLATLVGFIVTYLSSLVIAGILSIRQP